MLSPYPREVSRAATAAGVPGPALRIRIRRPGWTSGCSSATGAVTRLSTSVSAAASRAGPRRARPTTGAGRVHGCGAEQPDQGGADAVEHRVAAGQDRDAPAAVRVQHSRQRGHQRRGPRHPLGLDRRREHGELAGAAEDHLCRGQGRGRRAGESGPAVGADADHGRCGGFVSHVVTVAAVDRALLPPYPMIDIFRCMKRARRRPRSAALSVALVAAPRRGVRGRRLLPVAERGQQP